MSLHKNQKNYIYIFIININLIKILINIKKKFEKY